MTNFKKISLYAIATLPILSLQLVSIAVILFTVYSIFLVKKKNLANIKNWFLILLHSLPFVLCALSLLWTENMENGFKIIEKSLALFLIPFCVFIGKPFTQKYQINQFIKTYIVSAILFSLLTLIYITTQIPKILNASNAYYQNIRLRQNFEQVPIIGEHPIYFSLLIGVALILLIHNRFKNKILNYFSYLIFAFSLLLSSSKGVLIALFIVGVLYIIINTSNKLKALGIIYLFILTTGILFYFSPVKTRITEIFETKNLYAEGIHFNSFNLRMGIYNCGINIALVAPIYGYGAGDVQTKLNDCYTKFNTKAYEEIRYNTHNQYLDYWASYGVLGLTLILSSFIYFLWLAIKNKNQQYFYFLILILVAFCIENVLSRNTGIILFSMFNSLFSFIAIHKIDKS